MSGMFAIVVSGRLVQTEFEQVDVNKWLITIPNVDTINHIVVFMTGQSPLAPDLGASIHYSSPNPNQPVSVWRYLGQINNEKPSAIFKITNLKEINPNQCSGFFSNQQAVANYAQIGISVEPLITLNAQIPEVIKNGDNQLVLANQVDKRLDPSNLILFATKTAESLFHHVASFATQIAGINEQIVPVSAIESWYNNFKRKLESRPYFWLESD